MPAPIISVQDVSLHYPSSGGDIHALNNINLDIEAGDFVTFIGPSGCGKTSLLRAVADLEQVTQGSILVNGKSPSQARLEKTYGYIFQSSALFPWETARGNIATALKIMGYSKAEQKTRTAKVLQLVGLEEFADKYPSQLSGGMRQRVSIARALSFDADILLMDEPFGALDEITRDHLNQQLLLLWQQTQKTICFVTHSIQEAAYLSTKIVVLSKRPGKIIDIIETNLPKERPLSIKEDPKFVKLTQKIRQGLKAATA